MKIESQVPQAMDNPMPPTFGRIDALRGSSVQITKITDATKRHENQIVGPLDHEQSYAKTFGRIDALRGSSVQITKITDSTKHHENQRFRTGLGPLWDLGPVPDRSGTGPK